MLKKIFLFLLFSSCVCREIQATGSANKSQITYLMQAKEVEKSIALYKNARKGNRKHDFELLQQMALILLEQGARSNSREAQLLSMYGSGVAGVASSLDVLEAGVKSEHAETQVAAIQFLGQMQDDRSDQLLIKAMSSKFFFARMEAALHLAMRKHRAAVGQIESLMYRIPPQARFFFPQFFALIGTSEAVTILRHLMEDRVTSVRVEALLSAARFGRDDLLPSIRMNITHVNVAEQEASAFAVGVLKDSKSARKLKRLLPTAPVNVQIAAAKSLYTFGDAQARDLLLQQADKGNLFAIAALANVPEGKDLLARLCKHPTSLSIRINAAIALIQQRDPRCLKALMELFVRDIRDMGLQPQQSLGKTLLAFKPVFSSKQQSNPMFDVRSATHAIRQKLLVEAMHLPEKEFLKLAAVIFESGQTDLISTLVRLLESIQSPQAVDLLKQKAEQAGMPLLRAYCNVALFRMRQEGSYESNLKGWIQRNQGSDMIRFRPLVPLDQRIEGSVHELTPEDSSRVLIEVFQALVERQQESGIDILLNAIQKGNHNNRYVLAGLLLRALQ